ncbi:hypothetical protein [Ensifer adhaerens]|uniref:hypothetical protein n=1 Tax=Ensifer adhaerens TaxID=106592 RepID=UPI000ABDEEF3|nr:hypothetical protein [Ensifer adhaerens]
MLSIRATAGNLYNLNRLAENEVQVAAAIYFDDMYADAELSYDTCVASGMLRPR